MYNVIARINFKLVCRRKKSKRLPKFNVQIIKMIANTLIIIYRRNASDLVSTEKRRTDFIYYYDRLVQTDRACNTSVLD